MFSKKVQMKIVVLEIFWHVESIFGTFSVRTHRYRIELSDFWGKMWVHFFPL